MKSLRIAIMGLAAFALAGMAQAATYYVDVNYDGANGAPDGSSTKPWTNLQAAATAFTNGSGHSILVANGEYKSTGEGGFETFGTTGYDLAGKAGSWRGGYVGQVSGATFDWTTRTLPNETTTDPASVTVVNLTNANSRAFYSTSGSDYALNFQGFVFRDSYVSQASYDAGALYLNGNYSSETWVRDCVFINNRTTRDGGALYLCGRGGISSNLLFMGNQAGGAGGGLFQAGTWSDRGAGTTLNTSLFRNNRAADGGGLWNLQIMNQVRFENNEATAAGGAVNLGETKNALYKRCVFTGNQAGTYGGAIGNNNYRAGHITLENCLVVSNIAPADGYALYSRGAYGSDGMANVSLTHTTIADNTGGGVRSEMGDHQGNTLSFTVRNSIVATNGGNGLSAGGPVDMPITFNIAYNIVYGHTVNYHDKVASASHPNDLNVDPRFAALVAGDYGYGLAVGSPARDTATNVGVAVDLLGTPRPFNAKDTGYDRGCFEMEPPPRGTVITIR